MRYSRETHQTWLGVLVILACIAQLPACAGSQSSSSTQPPPVRATSYFLDCSSTASGNGTQASPWDSLSNANAFAFLPGDSLLLKRGTTCSGSLTPQGSGKNGAPIVIDAYGTGASPTIDAGMNEEGIRLVDQQYWEIGNLEIVGGDLFGVFVSAAPAQAVLNHLYFRNLDLHGAHHTSVAHGDSGELFVNVVGTTLLNDVLVDGISAHDSQVSDGIEVISGFSTLPSNGSVTLGTNVTIQNSTSHNIYGYGILVMQVEHSLIQNNVVHDTGLCPNCPGPGSATVGIACVTCRLAVMQSNESYANQTHLPYDGGSFGLEDARDSIVQYNYGHDSMGYCIGHFAGAGQSVNNVIRYNVCSNNGQKDLLSYQGELVLNGESPRGPYDSLQIYNNTFYWNPAGAGPVISAGSGRYSGSNQSFFKNNIIYSAGPDMIHATSGLALDNNIFWTTSGNTPVWQIDGNTYAGFSTYQTSTGQDSHSFYLDPMMLNPTYHEVGKPTTAFTLLPGSPAIGTGANVCQGIANCSMGTQDLWGNPLPSGSGYSIGANQPQ